MQFSQGRVVEIFSTPGGTQARIACPERIIPAPGQYLQATSNKAVLGISLFITAAIQGGFICAPPVPEDWTPGTALSLWGPLGHGFRLPASLHRLGLIAAAGHHARLAPLVEPTLAQGSAVTLFTDHPPGQLPSALEVYPLDEYPSLASWPDFIAVDLSSEDLIFLRPMLGLAVDGFPPCPGQVLVHTSMPCGGLADCGLCAVELRRGSMLACEHGPVFELRDLLA